MNRLYHIKHHLDITFVSFKATNIYALDTNILSLKRQMLHTNCSFDRRLRRPVSIMNSSHKPLDKNVCNSFRDISESQIIF